VTLASESVNDGETNADCTLLDTTGELQRWYPMATVVFMGKSLTAHGGQNPVEPIFAGQPVVFGPHMENFATLCETLVAKNAAMRVNDSDSLEHAVAKLLADADARRDLVGNAQAALSEHKGATMRTAELVHALRSKS
jgi:3-deoxy-D-manno-octulosonic-acid transferase